ncbi:nuclease PIN [Mycobacterium sp. 1164966.3]|uniref:sensor domain-containing protein n=1 Tax=Mycobacterium sp. 1164966.3 TaxID=1856861 RepID=UPI00080082FA|nr:sensor domain-containing protein [Mycobacterium sp. 1164966.3]OBA80330.1 nuclease PIN [Mycobacterium sp. 1164966.3]
MGNPQDPFGRNPFSSEPFGYDPFGGRPYGGPPEDYPEPVEPPVNTFATLSVVFAFLFAPAGAILGHLGLAQIRRTGERGRDRAVVGMALSYVFITLAVIALVGWAAVAAIKSNQHAAPSAASAPPPEPTVAPADLAGLLPGLPDVKRITGDQNLATGKTWDRIASNSREGHIDRPECWGSIGPGDSDAYQVEAVFGYRAAEFTDTSNAANSQQVVASVAAFREPAAAAKQLTQLLSGWRQCGGEVKVTLPSGQILTFSVGPPTDAGNGITTIEVETKGLRRSIRAIAAKANVVLDVTLSFAATGTTTERSKPAVGIANYVLGKIPG